jgi:hypothetical protein
MCLPPSHVENPSEGHPPQMMHVGFPVGAPVVVYAPNETYHVQYRFRSSTYPARFGLTAKLRGVFTSDAFAFFMG